MIRYTFVLASLRADSETSELADKIEKVFVETKPMCETHGKVDDPVVGIIENPPQFVLCCPQCCGGAVREMWEAEVL